MMNTLPPPTAAPLAPTAHKRRWPFLLAIPAVAIVGVGATVMAGNAGGADQTLSGTFTLIDSDLGGTWDGCYGTGGYDDFGPGMDVTVKDGDGKIIATATTESLTSSDAEAEDAQDSADFLCTVKFATDVPLVDFYAVEVGSRGDLSYSRDEMADADWTISLSLGSFDDLD